MAETYRITGVALGLVLLLMHCTSQKKITYEFPAAMKDPVKQEYLKLCEKGRVLYELNCAGCHSVAVKGRKVIPDFSVEQIEAYTLRISNPQHEKGLPEETITAEELVLVTTFLTYKKKAKAK